MANNIRRLRQQNLFSQFGGAQTPFETVDFGGGTVLPPTNAIENLDFSGQPDFFQQQESPMEEAIPQLKEKDWLTRLKEAYTPETEATNRFNELLGQYPEREEPDWKRKLVAGGMALGNVRRKQPMGGIETAEKVMYAPFEREKADWATKAQPYYQAANLERQSNINERQLLSEGIKSDINQQKADASTIRAQAYYFKQTHPDWEISFRNGRILAVNPQNPDEARDLGPTGGMNQMDLENLKGAWRERAYAQIGRNQANVADIRGPLYIDSQGNLFQAPTPGSMDMRPIGNSPSHPVGGVNEISTPRGTGAVDKTTPQQEEQSRINRASEMRAKYPEFAKGIKIDSQGNVTLTQPTQNWRGQYDPEKVRIYKEISKYIFGQEPAALPPSDPIGPNALWPENQPPEGFLGVPGLGGFGGSKQVPGEKKSAPTQTQAPQQQGRLKIRNKKTGKTGTIPNTRESIEAAVAAGNQVETPRNP